MDGVHGVEGIHGDDGADGAEGVFGVVVLNFSVQWRDRSTQYLPGVIGVIAVIGASGVIRVT